MMVGQRRADEIRRPLGRLGDKGIDVHQGEVEEIDLDRKLVSTRSARFAYDYLVVSLGARHAPETVEGFDEMALNLYEPAGCGQIRAALETFTGGTVGVLIPSMPFKCPAAPYEAALLVEAYLRQKGVRNRTEIHLYTPEHQPMPIAGPELGDALTAMLRARDIHFHPLYGVYPSLTSRRGHLSVRIEP